MRSSLAKDSDAALIHRRLGMGEKPTATADLSKDRTGADAYSEVAQGQFYKTRTERKRPSTTRGEKKVGSPSGPVRLLVQVVVVVALAFAVFAMPSVLSCRNRDAGFAACVRVGVETRMNAIDHDLKMLGHRAGY